MPTSIFSATRVGFPPTPLSAREPRFRTSSKRYREPTDLIPTPRVDQKRQKPYEPVYFWLPVTVGTALMMLMLGIALEVLYVTVALCDRLPTLAISYSPAAFTCLTKMVVYAPRRLDVGNATAEESVLLDYGYFLVFPARYFNFYFSIPWSGSSCLHEDMAHMCAAQSIPDIQTRGKTLYSAAQSIRSLGLAPDASELKAFAAAAGLAPNTGFNGSMTVNSTGILTNSRCSNPIAIQLMSNVSTTTSLISSTSLTGCTNNITFTPSVSSHQYGVEPAPCGSNARLNISQQPVMFWFYQQQVNGTEEVRTVFCDPFMELYYVYASADLSSGSLTDVTMVHEYVEDNDITGPPFNNTPLNAVIFDNNQNPFIQARANATKFGVPEAIFQSALQAKNGLQSVFDQPSGFLNRTAKYYTMHLALAAKSVYFVEGNNMVSSVEISQVPRLWINPFPAHILSVLLFVSGFISVWLHLVNRQQRRSLFLAAPPGTIAAAVSLTSRSGFGDLLSPYDDLAMMEKKLDGLRFELDKRTGAILVDDYEPTGKSPSPSPGKLPLGGLRS
ncbi:hypothetical protein B0H13DRAFT_1917529 [Mycena leptocephala]|nr:hypothetical protein B0H13DRAFT_1917529 [Mycena leptocephala]